MSHEGVPVREIAGRLHTRLARVSKWRQRFVRDRLNALSDSARTGKPRQYGRETDRRVLTLLDQDPRRGYAQWNGRLLAEALGTLVRITRGAFCESTKFSYSGGGVGASAPIPSSDPKQPMSWGSIWILRNMRWCCRSTRNHIFRRWNGRRAFLRLPGGKAVNGFSHCYKRHGTATLFAALNIVTGQVKTGHYPRPRRREFLDFMNGIIADNPKREIHVVLDNLNTHKPKRDRWLQSHPNVHLHFIPTYSSWLNLVECWFSIMSRAALRGASFTSPRQLRDAIDAFVEVYNPKAAPFEWTKAVVHQSKPKTIYSDSCK